MAKYIEKVAWATRDELDAKIKNMQGILNKLKAIFDVSDYAERFKSITTRIDEDPDSSFILIGAQERADSYKNAKEKLVFDDKIFEDGTFRKYIEEIDQLERELSSYTDFFQIHELYNSINNKIQTMTWETIGEIIRDTRVLIDLINSLNTLDDPRKIKIVNSAYETIYSVILHERIFERNDTFSYIKKLNINANRENLGRILETDIKMYLSEDEIREENLRTISTEGLEYDYLTEKIIEKIFTKKIGYKNKEYQQKREQAIEDIAYRYNKIRGDKFYKKSQ